MAKFSFHSNIHLNRDVSKGLMEMQEKEDMKGKIRDAMNSRLQKISPIGRRILEATEIVMRAVIFILTILAVELACIGLLYVICGR